MRRDRMVLLLTALLAVWATAASAASEPLLGEIMIFAGNYAPKGWLPCDGRLLQVSQYQALYSILGNRFGGDGRRMTFALPDLRGREVIGGGQVPAGVNYNAGETGGRATVSYSDFGPAPVAVRAATTSDTVVAHVPVPVPELQDQPADNHSPYLCIGYFIATAGMYPPRN